jgi:hypothetical protein
MKLPRDPIPLPLAAELADVTERYMRTLIQDGRVEGVKIGRNYIASESSARAFRRSESEGRPRKAKAAKGRKPRKSPRK